MADPVDQAQERERIANEEALARVALSTPSGPSRTHCVDCGDAIPAARRCAVPGCMRCVYCANDNELRARTRHGGAG